MTHQRKNFIKRNDGFECEHCHKKVPPQSGGSCRNHCLFCLYSKHVDLDVPGDREEACGGLMVPLYASVDPRKKAVLTHQCQRCVLLRNNRVAPDDDWEKICELSCIPH